MLELNNRISEMEKQGEYLKSNTKTKCEAYFKQTKLMDKYQVSIGKVDCLLYSEIEDIYFET